MRSSPFHNRRVKVRLFRVRPSSLVHRPSTRGFTYIGLLAIIVIIGISLGAAGRYWSNVMLREREAELLFRGDQYRQALEQYYMAAKPPQPMQYPQNIDDLLSDTRGPSGKRYLRQKYKDPITGEDFELLRALENHQIVGVVSKSNKTPLKKDNFDDSHQDLANKNKYSEWIFIARARPGQQPLTIKLPGDTSGGGLSSGLSQTSAGGQFSGGTMVQPVDATLPPLPGQGVPANSGWRFRRPPVKTPPPIIQ